MKKTAESQITRQTKLTENLRANNLSHEYCEESRETTKRLDDCFEFFSGLSERAYLCTYNMNQESKRKKNKNDKSTNKSETKQK